MQKENTIKNTPNFIAIPVSDTEDEYYFKQIVEFYGDKFPYGITDMYGGRNTQVFQSKRRLNDFLEKKVANNGWKLFYFDIDKTLNDTLSTL